MDAVSTALQTSITGWATALAADSANPQPSYSISGKSVSRNEWRDSLQRMIDEAQQTINKRNPFIIQSRGCVGRYY